MRVAAGGGGGVIWLYCFFISTEILVHVLNLQSRFTNKLYIFFLSNKWNNYELISNSSKCILFK